MDAPTVYQIRVSGHLSREWGEWFGDVTIDNQSNGEATLTGLPVDQAALHTCSSRLGGSKGTICSSLAEGAALAASVDITGATLRGSPPRDGDTARRGWAAL
jgi:hypothetical protein